jgi:hypothetical protein
MFLISATTIATTIKINTPYVKKDVSAGWIYSEGWAACKKFPNELVIVPSLYIYYYYIIYAWDYNYYISSIIAKFGGF